VRRSRASLNASSLNIVEVTNDTPRPEMIASAAWLIGCDSVTQRLKRLNLISTITDF
jgi:hypothetical protein